MRFPSLNPYFSNRPVLSPQSIDLFYQKIAACGFDGFFAFPPGFSQQISGIGFSVGVCRTLIDVHDYAPCAKTYQNVQWAHYSTFKQQRKWRQKIF